VDLTTKVALADLSVCPVIENVSRNGFNVQSRDFLKQTRDFAWSTLGFGNRRPCKPKKWHAAAETADPYGSAAAAVNSYGSAAV
jgi:hypothetical protein